MSLNVNGALFIGMLLTGIIAFFTGQLTFSNGVTSMPGLPEGIIVSNPITAVSDVINYGLYALYSHSSLLHYLIQQVHYLALHNKVDL